MTHLNHSKSMLGIQYLQHISRQMLRPVYRKICIGPVLFCVQAAYPKQVV